MNDPLDPMRSGPCSPGFSIVPKRKFRLYHQIVDHFEDVAHANLGKLTLISDFRRVAGVSQRTLLRAFRTIHGTTPHRYLHECRLSKVRQALLSSDSASETVTQVAMRFGFRELGRFATDYRARFGESPSETLHRTVKSAAVVSF